MRSSKLLFVFALLGIAAGLVAAHYFSIVQAPQPPLFPPPSNPYARGIYAQGILESMQANGENVNVYPDAASGAVTRIYVNEGEKVRKGEPLMQLDDSIQQALVRQQWSQAQAARALLEELKAQPRSQILAVSEAQVAAAQATLKTARDTLKKQSEAYRLDPKAVSKDALDTALNTAAGAAANLEVARRQLALVRAGAWVYDVRNQERQYRALLHAYRSSRALLDHYTLRAPADGVVMAINAAPGSYVSSQGVYDAYTQGNAPPLVLGNAEGALEVRCYVDEILIPRLPAAAQMQAQMSVRGSNVDVPLQFVRIQPYVSPKIELSNQRQERVDVRVLPVIFKFETPKKVKLYPGELVDVFIAAKQKAPKRQPKKGMGQ